MGDRQKVYQPAGRAWKGRGWHSQKGRDVRNAQWAWAGFNNCRGENAE